MKIFKKLLSQKALSRWWDIEIEFLDREFIRKIKELEKVDYDEKRKILKIDTKISEKETKELLFLIDLFGYEDLLYLLREYERHLSFKKGKKSLYQQKGYGLGGKGVFSGLFSPRFWLEWEAMYYMADVEKAWLSRVIDAPICYQILINDKIKSGLLKYMLEVGEKNSASWIYNAGAMLNKEEKILPKPLPLILFKEQKMPPKSLPLMILGDILTEIKDERLNQYCIINEAGITIELLRVIAYGPIDEPYLGLWKIKKDFVKKKTDEEIYKPIFSKIDKIRTALTKNDILVEKTDVQSQVQPQIVGNSKSKVSSRFNFYTSDRIVISPDDIREKTEETIKNSYYKNKDYQIYALLKYWLEFCIDKQEIHWLYGFLAFPSWRKGEEVKDYLETFGQCVTALKNLGKEMDLWAIAERTRQHGDKHRKGHWILQKVAFSSNILEAQKLYNEAKGSKDVLDKKIKLVKVLETYSDYLEAHILLAESWEIEKFKDVSLEEIKDMRSFFVEKADIYGKTCDAFFQLRPKRKADYWHHNETSKLIDDLFGKFKRIEHFTIVLEKWFKEHKILSSQEEECERIKDLIENKNHDFLLKGEPLIKRAIGNVLRRLGLEAISLNFEVDLIDSLERLYKMGNVDTEQTKVVSDIYNVFVELVREKQIDIKYLKAGDLENFKDYLTDTILKEIKKQREKEHPQKEVPIRDDYSEEYQKYPHKDIEDTSAEDEAPS